MTAPGSSEIVDRLVACAGSPVEISLGTDADTVGLCVRGDPALLAEWLGSRCGRLPRARPRYVRCDLAGTALAAVTWYRSADSGEFADLLGGIPAVLVADRWTLGRPDETSVYVSATAVRAEGLVTLAADLGNAAALPAGMVNGFAALVERTCRVGRPHMLAITINGPRKRLKAYYALRASGPASAVLGGSGRALLERFHSLRLPPGYAGYTVDGTGAGMRLYARPIAGRHLRAAVADVR